MPETDLYPSGMGSPQNILIALVLGVEMEKGAGLFFTGRLGSNAKPMLSYPKKDQKARHSSTICVTLRSSYKFVSIGSNSRITLPKIY